MAGQGRESQNREQCHDETRALAASHHGELRCAERELSDVETILSDIAAPKECKLRRRSAEFNELGAVVAPRLTKRPVASAARSVREHRGPPRQ